jgi:hypothetical protein
MRAHLRLHVKGDARRRARLILHIKGDACKWAHLPFMVKHDAFTCACLFTCKARRVSKGSSPSQETGPKK